FSTPHELEHLVAGSACSVLLFERRVLRKDFAQMLRQLDPALGEATAGYDAPSALASHKFPFLRHLAAIDGEGPVGALESWQGFLARGAGVSVKRVEARADSIRPSDPGVLFF